MTAKSLVPYVAICHTSKVLTRPSFSRVQTSPSSCLHKRASLDLAFKEAKNNLCSNKAHLTYGAMHASLGARYQDYCANVSRVFMLEPTKDLEKAYQALIDAQEAVVEKLRPGNTFAEAYEAGVAKMQEVAPNHVERMPKSFGFVTGFMFRDAALAINAKNTQKIQPNMVVIVHMGLQGVPNPKASSKDDRIVGLVVSDTYLVNEVTLVILSVLLFRDFFRTLQPNA